MACITFTAISLRMYTDGTTTKHSIVKIAWTRGASFVAGIVVAVVVNWVVWPFVARHELRKSLSSMLLSLGICYRGVVAKYIYHEVGKGPSAEDIKISRIQEEKLREGCLGMRELLDMTRHEIRVRSPFDSTPFSEAIDACERFLEHIIEVRQASLFFHPFVFADSPEITRAMMSVRRDAVAGILLNIYVMAGALRSKRPIPRYLPNSAAARKRLLDKMREVEHEHGYESLLQPRQEGNKRWAEVYRKNTWV